MLVGFRETKLHWYLATRLEVEGFRDEGFVLLEVENLRVQVLWLHFPPTHTRSIIVPLQGHHRNSLYINTAAVFCFASCSALEGDDFTKHEQYSPNMAVVFYFASCSTLEGDDFTKHEQYSPNRCIVCQNNLMRNMSKLLMSCVWEKLGQCAIRRHDATCM